MKKIYLIYFFIAFGFFSRPGLAQVLVEDNRLSGILNSWSMDSRTIIVSDRFYSLAPGLRIVNEAGRSLSSSSLLPESRVTLVLENNQVSVITVLR